MSEEAEFISKDKIREIAYNDYFLHSDKHLIFEDSCVIQNIEKLQKLLEE